MGRIELSGNIPEHLDALVTFIRLVRPDRLYGVRFDLALAVRPRVTSRGIDSVFVTDLSSATWAKVRERLDGDGLAAFVVLDAGGFAWSDERGTTDA